MAEQARVTNPMRVAAIGDADSVFQLAAVGVDAYPLTDAAQAERRIRRLGEEGYAVVFVTEALWEALGKRTDAFADRVLPAVLPIPGVKAGAGAGVRRIKAMVEKAVGSDVLFQQ